MSSRLAWPIRVRRLRTCRIQKGANVVLKMTFSALDLPLERSGELLPGIMFWNCLVSLIPNLW